MSSFQQSMETVFSGIFGCGCRAFVVDEVPSKDNRYKPSAFCSKNRYISDESKEYNKENKDSVRKLRKPKGMVPCDQNDSFLNETGTTAQDSFFSESFCSTSSESLGSGMPTVYKRKQEPPVIARSERELLVVPPEGNTLMRNDWASQSIRTIMIADPFCPVLSPTKNISSPPPQPQSLVAPPKVQRLTLDDALAFSSPRCHQGSAATTTTTTTTNNANTLYDTDGSIVDIPEEFSRCRSLDFLFSFPSTVSLHDERHDHSLLDTFHHQDYGRRGMIEDATYAYYLDQ